MTYTDDTNPLNLTSRYGFYSDRFGIATDHVGRVDSARITSDTEGFEVILMDDGDAVPVVCGEIIMISTEMGPSDGRCGLPVKAGAYACEGHTEERERYSAMSEYEKWTEEMQGERF